MLAHLRQVWAICGYKGLQYNDCSADVWLDGSVGEVVFLHVAVQDGDDANSIRKEGRQVQELVHSHLLDTAEQDGLPLGEAQMSQSFHIKTHFRSAALAGKLLSCMRDNQLPLGLAVSPRQAAYTE